MGESDLSPRTYLIGKFLHGTLSALFTAALARVFPLGAPVSALLAQQVDDLAALDFSTALSLSTVAAWMTFLVFLLLSAAAIGKKAGHSRRGML